MNMMLLNSYSFGDRKADVFQLTENLYRIDCYVGGRVATSFTANNLMEARKMADSFTDGSNKQMLNENA